MNEINNLKLLDAAVDSAVITYAQANQDTLPHLGELLGDLDSYSLSTADFKLWHFNEALMDLVVVCDERAKADTRLNISHSDPYAWLGIARDGIRRVKRNNPDLGLDHRVRLFSDNPAMREHQLWLYVDAKIRKAIHLRGLVSLEAP